jgi:hypothetical protein
MGIDPDMKIRMAVGAFLIPVVMALAARPAHAQSSTTLVAGGYSYLRDLGAGATPSTDYPSGWFVAVSRQIGFHRLALMGEIGGNSRENLAIEVQRLTAFLGGARVSLAHISRLETYAAALVGVERFSEPGFSEWSLAFQPGAGVDLPIWKALGARAGADYRIARKDGVTFKEFRIITGATIRFGGS